jgi:hypothetical protein
MMLLYHNYERRCCEPRDRIYSMLSRAKIPVSGTQLHGIQASYDDDITAVFSSVLEAECFRDDTIFVYPTALRRLLSTEAEPVVPKETVQARCGGDT